MFLPFCLCCANTDSGLRWRSNVSWSTFTILHRSHIESTCASTLYFISGYDRNVTQTYPRRLEKLPFSVGQLEQRRCTNYYRVYERTSRTMKERERVVGKRVGEETILSKKRFGFMPGTSTTEPNILC